MVEGEEEKEEEKEDEMLLGIKTWITKSVLSATLLLLISLIIERYTGLVIVTHIIIATTIALCLGFLHEGLHYRKAKKLGYEPKWWRTRFRMGFEIESHSKRSKWIKDKKEIGVAPYYVVVPLSFLIFGLGVLVQHLGIIAGGFTGILLHIITYRSEGVES